MIPTEAVEAACTCHPTDPKYWFTHYGAVEPGSAMEPNPDCPVHFPRKTTILRLDDPDAKWEEL